MGELMDHEINPLTSMTDGEVLAFIRRVLGIFNGFDGPSADQIWWRTDREYAPVTFLVNCNDLFWWGTADCENLTPDNIHILEKAVADCEAAAATVGTVHAPELFCARVRNMRPQGACYKHIDKTLWPLFDAAGPPRETGLGNPLHAGQSFEDHG